MERIRLAAALLFMLAGGAVHGASALRLPVPTQFGRIAAFSYDTNGRRDGEARLSMNRTAAGDVLLQVDIHLDTGARTHLRAWMQPVDHGQGLRLLTERSWSRNAHGVPIAAMTIDHRTGVATCTGVGQGARSMKLPTPDRVLNVPLNLFLQPLVAGKVKQERFQTLACGKNIRLIDTEARVTGRIPAARGCEGFVRVHCVFKLGPFLSVLAGPFLPNVVFWFDAGGDDAWVAHQAPLYANGPSVLLVRRSVHPADLDADLRRAEGGPDTE
ncbi:MAG: hypothetical protein WCC36_19200 [Gammaproteobacteria bacterium]